MSIHIETGNIFFNNANSGGSIYDFLAAQQNYDKKLLKFDFTFCTHYESCVSGYLVAIKNTNNGMYDMLPNKNSKLLFYIFNDYFHRHREPVQKVRHTIIAEDEYGQLELKKKDQSYFRGKLLEISKQENFQSENFGTDAIENELIFHTINDLQISKHFYYTLYEQIANNLREMILLVEFNTTKPLTEICN